jgi:hypothetical protein
MKIPYWVPYVAIIVVILVVAILNPVPPAQAAINQPYFWQIVVGLPLALVGGPFLFFLLWWGLEDLRDKVRCRKLGHIPVHDIKLKYVTCNLGQQHYAGTEEDVEHWHCSRCFKKLEYQERLRKEVIAK